MDRNAIYEKFGGDFVADERTFVCKEDQLTLYLNMVWFGITPEGRPIFGFANAARAFFDKPVAQLSEEQYIAIVAMVGDPRKQKVKFDQVVQAMLETGRDMSTKYKETSQGGLAVCVTTC